MTQPPAPPPPPGGAAPSPDARPGVPWPLFVVLLVSIVAVGVVGVLWYRRQAGAVWRDAGESIAAVADLRLQQIAQWRRERLADAQVLQQSPNTLRGLEIFARGDRGSVNVERLREWLRTFTVRGYAHAAITDDAGRVLVAFGTAGHADDPSTRAAVAAALHSGEIGFGTLHRAAADGSIRLDLVVPLRPLDGTARSPFGAVVLEIDPAQFLYPLLATWPTPSRTAEVLLVQREGDSVVFLNELRHRSGTALRLRVPVADTGVAAVQAVEGREGLVEARDYRGERILAALRRVPGAPWALVAKIDAEEVREPLRARTLSLALLLLGLLVGAAAVVWALWRQRTARHFQDLYEAEVRRRALAQHYESLTRFANDIILLSDADGRIVDANERALETYGYTREELLRLNVADLRASRSRDELAFAMREVAERGGAVYEVAHRRKDGSTFPIEASVRVFTIDGRPHFQGIIRDISERRRHEGERSRLVAAIEQASESVVMTDVAGTIQYVNPAFERITGYSREEAIGANPRLLKSGRQDADFYQGLWATVLAGGVWQGRMSNRRKDGTVYDQQTTISPVRDATGAVVNLVAVARDVTRETALESQLRQVQKMEEVGRLAGGVAHDFNNLLTAIIGSAELVLAEIPADAPAHLDVQNIQRAARRGAELTQKLLAVSRRQRLATRTIGLGEVVHEFARLVRRVLREDIELVVRAEVPGPGIHGDPGAVDQILMNLVTNARDAIPGSGTVAVEVAAVELSQDDCDLMGAGTPGSWVLLAVSDNGSGMTEDVRQRLFEPFFTTKEAGAGTGLGMPVVFGLVQEHGGFVCVDSDPGVGTTVRIYFPARGTAAPGAPREEKPGLPRGTETVLVVEDEDALRAFARRALEKHGYRVCTAANGLDALDVLRGGEAVALVLSDMVMPRMGGPQLEQAMRQAGIATPVLFTSGYAARTIDEQRLRDGDVPFLAKPWTVADLLRKVREVLDAPRG